jgi:hypothetical protein
MHRRSFAVCIGVAATAFLFGVPSYAIDPDDFPPHAVRLTGDPAASTRPRIAFDPDGNIVVVWQDGRYGNSEILWQKFDLVGTPLTGLFRVTETTSSSVRADVSCDASGRSHIVWQEGEASGVGTVYLGCRDSVGCKPRLDVATPNLSGHARVAALAGGEADVVWYRRTISDQDVYYRRYRWDRTYACERRFNAQTYPAMEKDPVVAINGYGTAEFLWSDLSQGWEDQIRQAWVDNTCQSGFSVVFREQAYAPDIDIAGDRIERAFQYSNRIWRLVPGNPVCPLSVATSGCSLPSVGTTPDTSYVVWQDTRTGNGDIYFRQYLDCVGLTGDLPLTLTSTPSANPSLAVNHGGSGDWAVVWQEDLGAGNTEIFMTSSRQIDSSQSFAIAGTTFDKQIYFNGNDQATIRIVTQSVIGSSTTLALEAVLKTNLGDTYPLGSDSFGLSAGESHVSTFIWAVPPRDVPWDFSLNLTLRDAGQLVTSIRVPKAATGTYMTQAEIDAKIAEIMDDDCAPPVDECSMLAIGLVPGFGLPVQFMSFKSAICEMHHQWEYGHTWQAGFALLQALLIPIGVATTSVYGDGSTPDLVIFGVDSALGCGREALGALTGGSARSGGATGIDSLASEARRFFKIPYSNEIFTQGAARLRVGVADHWTTEDTLAINQAFVYPVCGLDYRWAHVGPEPVPMETGGENPHSAIEVEAVAAAPGLLEFGVLRFVAPDSSDWVRFQTLTVGEHSVARIALCDTTTVYALRLDLDGDGVDDEIWYPDSMMVPVSVEEPGVPLELRLSVGYPNPMAEQVTIRYTVPSTVSVDLAVYDAAGRRRATLLAAKSTEGVHSVTWDGRDEYGARLPAGIYLIRLASATGSRTQKVVLLR